MPLSDWLRGRQQPEYARVPPAQTDVPDGQWTKCESCGELVHQAQVVRSGRVCPRCAHHFPMTPQERIALIADPDSFVEWDTGLVPSDPLAFVAAKSYAQSIEGAWEKTAGEEAMVTGRAALDGIALVLGVMDFRFIGGSMGSVVGEKVARAFERARDDRLPVLMVCASGGARMQEGMLSLLQMAKTAAAVDRYRDARRPYIALLTNPTSGGVTASFATLADVIIGEPGAFIGFAGPRVIEQTIHQKVPKGFQSAEFALEHGLIDMVVARDRQREVLTGLFDLLGGRDSLGDGRA